ncbi:MAG: 2-oxoacid:ferredoxin oxidoreductase subunit beta [Candidatus Mcinerneyibacterium aminivorans]|uniref:2-oxoacid:ferredoxin oxidoreductase subunit beta n=1 Tax=Candidatus Mcinerneyibacterium aminivorans TaxID=2703815 RepID=A0A5D0MI53_9BACT|nr:MAG: 2-oxoacid:ferredoxin oxidoreductase subunit beta [Candidatus Mcinerneyibacterium aminivorans]
MNPEYLKYIRKEVFPTAFCPGCGHGILLNAFVNALGELNFDQDNLVVVSGIGCGGWIGSPHLNVDTLHTTHGRAIAYATGVKKANPDLDVVVMSGDGDLATIGGNHLIHAARRRLPITVICGNNNIYGMTGGQASATTPKGANTMTTPKGNEERPFDMVKLVKGAGADHVYRYTAYHAVKLKETIKKALISNEFYFIDVLTGCPVQYGRRNNLRDPMKMLNWMKDNSEFYKNEYKEDKIMIGEF